MLHLCLIYLIFVKVLVEEFIFPLLLEGDDDQGNKDVDEEEWKHKEVHHIKYGRFHVVVRYWSHIFICSIH